MTDAAGAGDAAGAAVLDVEHLTVRFGRRAPVVDDVTLRIGAGERLGLIGESGSGKSLTALAVMGLLPDTARATGSVLVSGTQILARSDRRLSRLRGAVMSMVFQEPMTALDPTMPVGRQVAEALLLHGGDRRSARVAVIETLDEVGLPDPVTIARRFPHQLSGGQRQRVVLAMALINSPELLLCDEPTTALDVTVQARVLDLLDRQLTARDAACLFISHDLAVVARLCRRVAVMLDGRIVEQGDLRQVITAPQHPYTRGLVAAARLDSAAPGSRLPTMADVDRRWSDD